MKDLYGQKGKIFFHSDGKIAAEIGSTAMVLKKKQNLR